MSWFCPQQWSLPEETSAETDHLATHWIWTITHRWWKKKLSFGSMIQGFTKIVFILSLSPLSLLVITHTRIGFQQIYNYMVNIFSHIHSNRTPLLHVGQAEKIWKSHPFPLPFGNLFLKLFHFFRRRKISLNLFNFCLKIIRNSRCITE